jgi:hypothetical protein
MKRQKTKHVVVDDDELHPLTRTYRISSDQPPPLPGRSFSVVALAEATFIVRDDELCPLTRAEWVETPTRAARRARQPKPVRLAS